MIDRPKQGLSVDTQVNFDYAFHDPEKIVIKDDKFW